MNPEYIILHHSLTADGQTVNTQAIRDYHVVFQKWRDIGYHYLVECVNWKYEILKGRMDNEAGAHCVGFNERSLGICAIGNFDAASPPISQMALLKKICNSLMEIYGIKADHVLGHWETYGLRGVPVEKSCPGNKFNMDEFRKGL